MVLAIAFDDGYFFLAYVHISRYIINLLDIYQFSLWLKLSLIIVKSTKKYHMRKSYNPDFALYML